MVAESAGRRSKLRLQEQHTRLGPVAKAWRVSRDCRHLCGSPNGTEQELGDKNHEALYSRSLTLIPRFSVSLPDGLKGRFSYGFRDRLSLVHPGLGRREAG